MGRRSIVEKSGGPPPRVEVPDPLIASLGMHAGGARLVLSHARLGTKAASVCLKDVAYAALLAEAINKVTRKHFPPERQP